MDHAALRHARSQTGSIWWPASSAKARPPGSTSAWSTDEQIASDVSAFAYPMEIAGIFGVIATALPGHSLAELDAAIEEEIAAFLEEGPSDEELHRMVTSRRAAFVRGIERVGGFGGKSDQLARNETYLDDPAFYKTTLARWSEARPADLQAEADKWMTRGQFILEVLPFPQTSVSEAKADVRAAGTGSPPMRASTASRF